MSKLSSWFRRKLGFPEFRISLNDAQTAYVLSIVDGAARKIKMSDTLREILLDVVEENL